MERSILHCDLNNFFASVELRDRPDLREKPVAVCGCAEERHGIVLAKNERAKRYGVKTAETVWQARKKCPELVILPPHHDQYILCSRQVREIYYRYTDLIEPFGIDECWLDVTGSFNLFGSGERIAHRLREEVKRETGLTISVGVSFNKIFAKLGSDMKKPDAVTTLRQSEFRGKIWPLPVGELLGVGRATTRALNRMGIMTIGDLALSDPDFLQKSMGKMGRQLWRYAAGLDDDPVMLHDARTAPKSIGNSVTCVRDLTTEEEVRRVMLMLSEKVCRRVRAEAVTASCVQLQIRDNLLHWEEHQTALAHPTHLTADFLSVGMDLFRKHYNWLNPVRALGIRACGLKDPSYMDQVSLFQDHVREERLEILENTCDGIVAKFGKQSVTRAALLQEMPIPGNRETQPAFRTFQR